MTSDHFLNAITLLFMKSVSFAIGITVLLSVCSCESNDRTQENDVPVVEIDLGQVPMADSAVATVFRNPSYVVLKGAMLGTITQMLDWGDRYVIFDRKQNYVYLFDTAGQLIRRVGQIGKGPREYVHISCVGFDCDNDLLMLYADQPDKMIYYDREGKFVKEESNRSGVVFNRGIVARNGQLYGVQSANRGETGHTLFRIDADEKSTPFLPFENWPASVSRGTYMTAADSGTLWISRPFDNRVYRLDPEADGPKAVYLFDFGSGNLSARNAERLLDDYSVIKQANEERKVYHVTKLSRLGRYLFFSAVGGDGWLLDTSTDRVRKLTTVPATGGLQLGIWSYIPLENQQNKAVLYILPMDAEEYNKAERVPVLDSLYRANEEFQNPILVIYDVKG